MIILIMIYLLVLYVSYRIELNAWEIIKIWNHKKCVFSIGKFYYGWFYLPMYTHDIDKIFLLLFLSKKCSSYIHKKLAFHHFSNIFKVFFYKEMILDWESGRFTKTNKHLTAFEWFIQLQKKETFDINFFSLRYNVSKKDLEELDTIFSQIERKMNLLSRRINEKNCNV